MKEYILVDKNHLWLIQEWLKAREPLNAVLALDELITRSPLNIHHHDPILLNKIDNDVKMLVG